ncbi:MAG: OFA family MFS transporter [Spirochaetaceae bacterium]|nr:OFA family MFS transporter [Spirochaetaceae bacterium]
MNKRQGVFSVIAATAILHTLGIVYVWSVFQTGIANTIFNGNNAAAGLAFSLLFATLAIGSITGGKLVAKYSTRFVIFVGGIILSAGFFLASFVTANVSWLLWITYGIMGGIGMGFTYSPSIACAQKWYPHKKGFVTGIILSAHGLGGVVFAPIVENLIFFFGGTGVGESKTFMVLSAVFLVVCTVSSLFMKNPPEDYVAHNATPGAIVKKPVVNRSPVEMLKTSQFYLIAMTFALACMGGIMMIGFAKPVAVAKGLEATATIGVLAVSMFNSLGRLFWGAISDKLGRINTIIIMLSGTAIVSLLVATAESYWVYVLIAFIGFFYGGAASSFPSLTADTFGTKHLAINYGYVLLGLSIGSIASSQIAGYYKNVAAGNIDLMFPAFAIVSCCAVVGIVLMLILKAKNKQNQAGDT